MIVFFFTNQATTHLLLKHLETSLRPPNFFGRYMEVLPYIRDAFGNALTEFGSHVQSGSLRSELLAMVATLCDPDPTRRGLAMRGATAANQFSLERYISRFDALAVRAEIGLFQN
jgi:hypothetical protein